MGRETLGEVLDGSGDPRKNPGQVEGQSGRFGMGRGLSEKSGTGRGTRGEVRDGLRDPQDGPIRFGGLSGNSETDRGTLGEFRDGSGDPQGGP